MDYKKLFNRILLILTKPSEAWVQIKPEGKQEVITTFVYPLLAISSLAVFIGALFSTAEDKAYSVFSVALTECSTMVISLFGGVYLACFIAEKLTEYVLKINVNRSVSLKLVGYGFVLIFLETILVSLLPDFRLIAYILQFYGVFILWEGMPICIKHEEEQRLKLTLIFFFSIFIAPLLIQLIFSKMINFMN